MTLEQFGNYRFSKLTLGKIINQDDIAYGYEGKVTAVNFAEGLIEIQDIDGEGTWKRCENLELSEREETNDR